jgi:TrmH family RNA methyltransferase
MGPQPIGKNNPRLGEIRQAFREGCRTADGLLPIEGPNLVSEAQRAGVEIEELFVEVGVQAPKVPGAMTYLVDGPAFRTLKSTRTSQGIIALVRLRPSSIEEMLLAKAPLLVVLCGVQDPGNGGTIIRVADAFGASGCVGTEGTVHAYNDKLVRASAGSILRVPHCWDIKLAVLADRLRSENIRIVGTAGEANIAIEDYDWRQPTAVLFGNEGAGLSSNERDLCDTIVGIPHHRHVESLNAGVAAGVTLHEAWKQRRS